MLEGGHYTAFRPSIRGWLRLLAVLNANGGAHFF